MAEELLAGERSVKGARPSYKVGMYFSLCVVLLVTIWTIASEIRWIMFDSGVGSRFYFDTWMVFGVIFMAVAAGFAFTTLGHFSSGWTKECAMLGGAIHLEERQVIAIWAAIIGMVLGMGFWDIVTEVHLSLVYGFMNIWNIEVIVLDFGFYQMIFPVWALVIIGVIKMGAVVILWVLAIKNMRRGTVCELAGLDKAAIFSRGPTRLYCG